MKTVILTLCLVAVPVLVSAQTPVAVNAQSGWEFPPSPDHFTLLPDGTPKLMAYEGRFNIVTSGCPAVAPQSFGKPSPSATGPIVVDPWAPFGALPANCVYTMYIVAIGQQDVEGPPTPDSDPFVRVLPTPPAAAGRPVLRP